MTCMEITGAMRWTHTETMETLLDLPLLNLQLLDVVLQGEAGSSLHKLNSGNCYIQKRISDKAFDMRIDYFNPVTCLVKCFKIIKDREI